MTPYITRSNDETSLRLMKILFTYRTLKSSIFDRKHDHVRKMDWLSNDNLRREDVDTIFRKHMEAHRSAWTAQFAKITEEPDLQKLVLPLHKVKDQLGIDVDLSNTERRIIYRGDLQRRSSNKITWVDLHAVLLDNFFVLYRSSSSSKVKKYGVFANSLAIIQKVIS